MRKILISCLGFVALPAMAQDRENVVLNALDAFGARVGVEQAGLYSEGQVRGFNLGNTGAYRIDDVYFVREGGQTLPDSLLQGVNVNVGISAARLYYPAPSGVVNYKLRTSLPGDHKIVASSGMRENNSPFFETSFSFADDDGVFAVAGGALWYPHREYSNKTKGNLYNFGIVPQWQPSENVRLRAIFSAEHSRYSGNLSFASTVPAPPPKLPVENYGTPWADVQRLSINSGILMDADLGDRWTGNLALFYADSKSEPSDFTLLTARPDKNASATFFRNTRQRGNSYSGEGRLAYRFETGDATHSISTAVRGRRSRALTAAITPITYTGLNLDRIFYPPEPVFAVPAAGANTDVDQYTGSVAYSGLFLSNVELRAGLHRTRYDKAVQLASGVLTERVENKWLYNASLVWALNNRLTMFVDTVKGLEESGIAPQNALNKDEVLPPVVTEQYEVGVRYTLTPELSASAALFDVKKPTPGLRPDGIYTLFGDVRHRGAELSVTGQVAGGVSVLLGVVAMKPRLSGPLVEFGASGVKPVGVSSTNAVANIDYRLPWATGWSVDARLTWQGGRPADTLNTFSTGGFALLALGSRYQFKLGSSPALLRFVVSNVFTERPWFVSPGGLFSQGAAATYRLTLRVETP